MDFKELPTWGRGHYAPHTPIETTVWYCPSGGKLVHPRQLRHTSLVEYMYRGTTDSSSLDAYSTVSRTDNPWVFRLTAHPRRHYTLNDMARATAPCICSVIFAMLWVVLMGDTQTAVTFVSFISVANISVLILLCILCMREG